MMKRFKYNPRQQTNSDVDEDGDYEMYSVEPIIEFKIPEIQGGSI
jgi:hypothetical protein